MTLRLTLYETICQLPESLDCVQEAKFQLSTGTMCFYIPVQTWKTGTNWGNQPVHDRTVHSSFLNM